MPPNLGTSALIGSDEAAVLSQAAGMNVVPLAACRAYPPAAGVAPVLALTPRRVLPAQPRLTCSLVVVAVVAAVAVLGVAVAVVAIVLQGGLHTSDHADKTQSGHERARKLRRGACSTGEMHVRAQRLILLGSV